MAEKEIDRSICVCHLNLTYAKIIHSNSNNAFSWTALMSLTFDAVKLIDDWKAGGMSHYFFLKELDRTKFNRRKLKLFWYYPAGLSSSILTKIYGFDSAPQVELINVTKLKSSLVLLFPNFLGIIHLINSDFLAIL